MFAHEVTKRLGLYPKSDDYCTGVMHAYDLTNGGCSVGCQPPGPLEAVEVDDAFVEQDGSSFYAIQGNNGRKLRSFSNREDAEKYVEFLHRKNKPGGANRGGAARKKVQAQRREKEE